MIVFTIFVVIFLVTSGRYISLTAANKSDFNYTLDHGYPIGAKLFGGIAGVDIDKDNNVIIFHRGTHKWDDLTFDASNVYLQRRDAPILDETVVTINPREKTIVRAWGKDTFFMPHGLSLDQDGNNVWLTDVALHQVFKYPVNGSKELLALGTPFVPGRDESHFCKPTSVADTGEFIFVADGYCNSRIVMFSQDGNYLGEFGQSAAASYLSNSNSQPTFYIPHKIVYAKDAKMLCVADRENGRIQCFSFEPRHDKMDQANDRLILNGAIKAKFTLADPLFNGRLFSLDYSPLKGGIIVAVSGQSPFVASKVPQGFVYNVTTGQLISRFAPPGGQTFGMAHDLAITGDDAGSLFVVDIQPVNLWKFSRPIPTVKSYRASDIGKMAGEGFNRALTMVESGGQRAGVFFYLIVLCAIVTILVLISKARRVRYTSPHSLYSNSYPASINRLFGGSNGYHRRPLNNGGSSSLFGTMFSRRSFYNMFDRDHHQQQNEFSRIPMEESDNSDNDKSDSDVEEFNINQASNIKINV